MVKAVTNLVIAMLLPAFAAMATEPITPDQIRQVIVATDTAAKNLDAKGIGKYLGEKFLKEIEVPHENTMASVQIDKEQYLAMIAQGWETVKEYSYKREDIVINIAPDGLSGESSSTITETVVIDGKRVVSKTREYAHYELENGTAVITAIEGHTLAGDTTSKLAD